MNGEVTTEQFWQSLPEGADPHFRRSSDFDYTVLDTETDNALADIEQAIWTEYLTGRNLFLRIGELLIEAKRILKGKPPGTFGDWRDANFPQLAERTSTRYMKLAREHETAKLAVLPSPPPLTPKQRKFRATKKLRGKERAEENQRRRKSAACSVLAMLWSTVPKHRYDDMLRTLRGTTVSDVLEMSRALEHIYPDYEKHQNEINSRNEEFRASLPAGNPDEPAFVQEPYDPWYLEYEQAKKAFAEKHGEVAGSLVD